jgi:hypothetical protein
MAAGSMKSNPSPLRLFCRFLNITELGQTGFAQAKPFAN